MYATKELRNSTWAPAMVLSARSAADLMTPNPISVRDLATVGEAVVFLAEKRISAAPVINAAGRPVGVVSRTDLLKQETQRVVDRLERAEEFERLEPPAFSQEKADETKIACVRDVMTPWLFCVRRDTTVTKVIEKLVAL